MWDSITKTLLKRELDNAIHLIKGKQGNFYERMARLLTDLLLKNWDKSTRVAIQDVIRLIKNGEGKIKQEDVDSALQQLARRLGMNFAAKMDERLFSFIIEVYTYAQREVIGVQPSFNVVDNRAIRWLQENHVYWIGSYYEAQLADRIKRLGQSVLSEGMDRSQAGRFFKQAFGKEFKRSRAYWEGLANHVTTRAREFGHTEAYVKAGIQYLRVVAVLDKRTSKICRHMHGRIIPVSKAVALRDALIRAKGPNAVKRIAPWVAAEQIGNVPSSKLPKGMALPPYHFNCRTRTVKANAPVRIEQVIATGASHEALYNALLQLIVDQEQPSRREVLMLIDRAMASRWPPKKFYNRKKKKWQYSVQYHFDVHGNEKYTQWSRLRDMNQEIVRIIRGQIPRDVYLQHRLDDINLLFHNGRVVVVVDVVRQIIRTAHSAPDTDTLVKALGSMEASYLKVSGARSIVKTMKRIPKAEVFEFAVWSWLNKHEFLLDEGIDLIEKAMIIKYRTFIAKYLEKHPKALDDETRAKIDAVDVWLLNYASHPKIIDLLSNFTTEPFMTYWWEDIETLRKEKEKRQKLKD